MAAAPQANLYFANGATYALDAVPAPGAYIPTEQSTGVPAGAVLQQYTGPRDANGHILLDVPGTVLDSLHIDTFVIVRAPGCRVLRCDIQPTKPATSDTGIIDARDGAVTDLVVEDTTLHLPFYDWHTDGILGHDYTARRVRAYNVTDGFGAYNTHVKNVPLNVLLEAVYADQFFYGPVPKTEVYDMRTHADGLQIQGSGGVKVVGSRLEATVSKLSPMPSPYGAVTTGSSVGITPNVSPIAFPVELENNWFGGGARGVGIVKNTYGAAVDVIYVHDNVFFRTSHSGNAVVAEPTVPVKGLPLTPASGADPNGNVWDDCTPANYLRATP